MNAQSLILGYTVPVSIAIMVLWVVYRLLFTNSNRFQFNRGFLLGALLFSLALPLTGLLMGERAPHIVAFKNLVFPANLLGEVTITSEVLSATPLPEVVASDTAAKSLSLWKVLGLLYLIGVAVMAVLFIVKLAKLLLLIARSPKQKMKGFTAVYTHREQGSFSFFRYAFFPDESVSPDIVRHEMSHIAHGHSWDILFVELLMVLQWFNPFIYLYKRELQSLHEYTADHDVVANGVDKRNYMMLILQQCTAVNFSNMSNNFSLILTKKRIKMITRNEKARRLWWRLLATIPVLAVLLVVNTKVTAQEKAAEAKKITVEMGRFEIYNDDGTPMQLNDTVFYFDDGTSLRIVNRESPDPATGELRKTVKLTAYEADGSAVRDFNLNVEREGDTALYSIEPFSLALGDGNETKISSDNLKISVVSQQDRDSVYNVVEVMPEFPGGTGKLAAYLSENITYPEQAKEKNIGGRVFISFVIEKDGSVSNAEVMKSVGGGCDEEALRVVKAMPKWTPGKIKGEPVRVSYIVPIYFKPTETQPNKE